jgi:hypothetical protein
MYGLTYIVTGFLEPNIANAVDCDTNSQRKLSRHPRCRCQLDEPQSNGHLHIFYADR